IIMRAKTLQTALGAVSFRPVIELHLQIPDLLPKQARSTITTARLQFDNRRRDFDYARVEVNRPASWRLKRFARPRNHSPTHQAARVTEDLFGTPPSSIYQKIKLRFQANYCSRRCCERRALAKKRGATCCSEILHMPNTRSMRFAASARSQRCKS